MQYKRATLPKLCDPFDCVLTKLTASKSGKRTILKRRYSSVWSLEQAISPTSIARPASLQASSDARVRKVRPERTSSLSNFYRS